MSEFSSSLHFYQREADEVVAAAKAAGVRAAVFPRTGAFTCCVVEEGDMPSLAKAVGGLALQYWFYDDVGWNVQLYRDGSYRGRLSLMFDPAHEEFEADLDENDVTGFNADAFIEAGLVDAETARRVEELLKQEPREWPDFYWIGKTLGLTHFEHLGGSDLDEDNYGLEKHGARRVGG